MKEYCVYCHTSPSGKKYVGISCDPERRWRNGNGYEKNYLFTRAIKKYGWENFNHEILFDRLEYHAAAQIEKQIIADWHLTDPKCGYNLREGDNGPFSEESAMKMSLSRIGNRNCVGNKPSDNTRRKISSSLKTYYSTHPQYFQGKTHSKETIEKLKNRVFSMETKQKMKLNHADVTGAKNPSARPIIQMSMNGEIIERYPFARLAAQKYNLDLSTIIKCCKGRNKSCGGYRWAYDTNIKQP